MWEAVEFALAVTLPNALLLIFGWLLQRSGQIDGHFAHQAAKLVFHYGLPMLLFVQLSRGKFIMRNSWICWQQGW